MIKIFYFYLNSVERNIEIIHQNRSHENAIIFLQFLPDSRYLVSSTKNEIFIFLIKTFEEKNIVDIDWHSNSKKISWIPFVEIPLLFNKSKTFILI